MTEPKQQNEKTYPMDNGFLLLCLKYYKTKGSSYVYMSCVDYKNITTFISPNITNFQNKHRTNLATIKQINTILQNSENDFLNFHFKRSPYRQKGKDRFEELHRHDIGKKMTKEAVYKGLKETDDWAKEQYLKDSQFPEKFKNSRIKILMVLQQNDAILLNSREFGTENITISDSETTVTTFTITDNNIR